MAKVPDVVRVRRLYMAVVNLEKELAPKCEGAMRWDGHENYLDACKDLRDAARKLACAASDLEAAEKGASE